MFSLDIGAKVDSATSVRNNCFHTHDVPQACEVRPSLFPVCSNGSYSVDVSIMDNDAPGVKAFIAYNDLYRAGLQIKNGSYTGSYSFRRVY